MQADAPFRMLPGDLEPWYVRNDEGRMVPFSAFAATRWTYGSPQLERFNGVPSVELLGEPAPGRSSGEAMAEIEAMAARLPPGIGVEWTGLSYQERLSGSQAPALYAISLLVVFLCLAALYESWSIPFSVMLVVPLGVLGALVVATLPRAAQRRLLPGRPADHDRALGEERDPDRRVCEGAPGAADTTLSRPPPSPRGSVCGRSS